VPAGIDPHEVETCLAGQPGVREVHDLHIRAMSTTGTALTAHLVRDAGTEDGLLDRMRRGDRQEFRVRAGMMGAKEPRHAATQRADDP